MPVGSLSHDASLLPGGGRLFSHSSYSFLRRSSASDEWQKSPECSGHPLGPANERLRSGRCGQRRRYSSININGSTSMNMNVRTIFLQKSHSLHGLVWCLSRASFSDWPANGASFHGRPTLHWLCCARSMEHLNADSLYMVSRILFAICNLLSATAAPNWSGQDGVQLQSFIHFAFTARLSGRPTQFDTDREPMGMQ